MAENRESGATRSSVSDASGTYQIALLPPGRYRIKAELAGFKTEEQDLTLQVSQNARIDMAMGVGAIEESVTVSAAAPLVDTRDAAMGQVVEQQKIVELPLNGRNFRDLGLIAPGVQQQTQNSGLATRGGGLYINGARIYDNNYILDGFDNNDITTGEILTFPSPDSIQEFKILGASYGAEYGFASGGIISLISRSGGQQYHGNAFGFFRNDTFDAKNYFSTTVPKLDRKQYGGTIGGPAGLKNLFFFGSYERTQLQQGQPFTAAVPTDALRSGNFGTTVVRDPLTGQPFPNNVIPQSRISPQAVTMLELFPRENNAGDPTRNYVSSPDLDDQLHVATGKVDFNASSSNQFSTRYSIYWDTQSTPGALPAIVTAVRKHNQQVGGTWTHVYGSRTVQEVRGGWGDIYNGMFRDDPVEDWSQKLGITGTLQQAVPGRLGHGAARRVGHGIHRRQPEQQPVHPQPSPVAGLLRPGADRSATTRSRPAARYRSQQMSLDDWRNPQGTFTFTGRYSGSPWGDYLLGYPNQTTTFVGLVFMEQKAWQTGIFVQDEWRATPRVTLNYGVRYEYQAPTAEVENRWGTFVPELGESVQVGTNGVPSSIRNAREEQLRAADRRGVGHDRRRPAGGARRLRAVLQHDAAEHRVLVLRQRAARLQPGVPDDLGDADHLHEQPVPGGLRVGHDHHVGHRA